MLLLVHKAFKWFWSDLLPIITIKTKKGESAFSFYYSNIRNQQPANLESGPTFAPLTRSENIFAAALH